MNQEKIGILTGGGDCSGLNSAIKSITQVASIHKFKVIGIRDGWKGLSCCDAIYKILNNKLVDQIDYFGGTILGTSRTNPYVVTDGIKNLLINWKKLKLINESNIIYVFMINQLY
jgi:6-phosphofructokinase 1